MPSVTTTYDSPIATGANREDLDDIAYDISPEETPVMSMAGRDSADAVTIDWIEDALGATSAGGVIEGNETTETAAPNPTRLGNVCQINERIVTISGSQMAVKSAGNFGKMARETARRTKELKRDVEAAMIRMQPRVNGNEATARQTRSIPHFITNRVGDVAPASETAAAGAITGGAALSDATVIAAMKAAYEEGGTPSKLVVSPDNKEIVATFTGRVNEVLNVSETKVTFDVTVISTSFGRLEVVIDRFFADNKYSLLLDPEYVKLARLRPIARTKIAVIGDKETALVNTEFAVKVTNRAAHAVIARDV